jgi:pimeloyl-[acyl-carrier protein] methyl ester esterase
MRHVLSAVCVAALMSIAAAHAAPADPNRLFSDSSLVVQDRISVEVVGKGPDLVLIPGLASSRATWKATAERLKGRYRLHLVQVAGFSGEPARANAKGEVVVATEEAIDAYIRDQKLAPATVIGHSLGGTMTLMLAERHPGDIRKGMLVDALPYYGTQMGGPTATPASMKDMAIRTRDQTASATDQEFRASSARNIAYMVSAPADRDTVGLWAGASDHAVVGQATYDDLQLDLRPDLGKVAAPITLLYPDYTPIGAAPGAVAQQYADAYASAPTVKRVLVEHSLHFIMLDQPAAFDKALDEFLAR